MQITFINPDFSSYHSNTFKTISIIQTKSQCSFCLQGVKLVIIVSIVCLTQPVNVEIRDISSIYFPFNFPNSTKIHLHSKWYLLSLVQASDKQGNDNSLFLREGFKNLVLIMSKIMSTPLNACELWPLNTWVIVLIYLIHWSTGLLRSWEKLGDNKINLFCPGNNLVNVSYGLEKAGWSL